MSTGGIILDESQTLPILSVSGQTDPKGLADSIAVEARRALDSVPPRIPSMTLHAIGPHAVNQAVKSIPIANGYIAPRGIVFVMLPTFETKKLLDGADATVIRMRLISWRIGL